MSARAVYISVGSNIEPEANIPRGLQLLSRSIPLVGVSMFYRTPAIDRPEQPDYLNGVVVLETDRPPGRLRELLREIEHALGRERTGDLYAARTLDLDILLYGDAIVSGDGLEIPDPDITARPFLAAGLLELAPGLRLPGADMDLTQQIDNAAVAALAPAPALTRELKEKLL